MVNPALGTGPPLGVASKIVFSKNLDVERGVLQKKVFSKNFGRFRIRFGNHLLISLPGARISKV